MGRHNPHLERSLIAPTASPMARRGIAAVTVAPTATALAARASALAAWRSTARLPRGRHPSTARRRVLCAGLKDQRRDFLGAVDADPAAEHPAARAVAIRLVRCQSEALAHHASTLAARPRLSHDAADNYAFGKHVIIIVTPLAGREAAARLRTSWPMSAPVPLCCAKNRD